MQLLQKATDRRAAPDRCAQEVLAAIPGVMRFIRQQMRLNRRSELTVPQFRTLVFLHHHDRASLSDAAEHVGLSLPAMSRMADLLVKRGLLERRAKEGDRRRVSLLLTRRGKAAFQMAWSATEVAIAQRFQSLTKRELEQLSGAMGSLSRLFTTSILRADEGKSSAASRR